MPQINKHRQVYFLFSLVTGLITAISVFVLKYGPHQFQYVEEGSFIENLTVAVFFASSLIAIMGSIRNTLRHLINRYGVVALFGILLGLNEIGLGPFVINLPFLGDVEIDALHDFLKFAYQLYTTKHADLAAVLLLPFIMPVVIVLFSSALNRKGQPGQSIKEKYLRIFFFFCCLSSLANAILAIRIPTDPKNAILLGFSLSRLLMIGMIGFVGVLALHLLRKSLLIPEWMNGVAARINLILVESRKLKMIKFVSFVSAIFGYCCITSYPTVLN